MMRVQIYTNDREQPIDLTVRELHTRVPEIRTNEREQARAQAIDQTVREMIKDSTVGASPNILFTTDDGREGAIYLNTEKVAAVITSREGGPELAE